MRATAPYIITEKIASYLWKNKNSTSNNLYHGKTGMAIFFYELYRFTENEEYEDKGNELISYVASNIKLEEGKSFSYGALGVGWSLSILERNDFIELEEKEVFQQIDVAAIFHSCENYGIEKGFLGVATYLLQRLENRTIYEEEFHTLFEKIIEVNEILANSIHARVIESSLYAHDEIPYLLSYVRVSSEKDFLNVLSNLVLHYCKLLDLGIQPELAVSQLEYTIDVVGSVLAFLLSDEFINKILPRDQNQQMVLFLIFELYASLEIAKSKQPNICKLHQRNSFTEKVYGLISKIQIPAIEHDDFALFLKHLNLVKRLYKSVDEDLRMKNAPNPIKDHFERLNTELLKIVEEQIERQETDSFVIQKLGMSGLSGLGLYFLSLLTGLDENYINSLGI